MFLHSLPRTAARQSRHFLSASEVPTARLTTTNVYRSYRPITHRSGQRQVRAAALSLQEIPQEALFAGASAILGALGIAAWAVTAQAETAGEDQGVEATSLQPAAPPPPPRENAVLVFGATGRLGRLIVQKLLASGRTVVAACRTRTKAEEVLLGQLGLIEGRNSNGILFLEQVDVTDSSAVSNPELWRGVSQVVSALGAVFGRLPGGGMGFIDNMTSERVEAGGVANMMNALPQQLSCPQRVEQVVLEMSSPEDIAKWERLDDVIMGGQSSSGLKAAGDGRAIWTGDLITEGGGFCGARSVKLDLDLSAFDGLMLRVKGDGQIFKFNIKTTDQEDTPESTYQTTFETQPGDWTNVHLPWHAFVPVKRAQSDPEGAPLDPSKISKFGLVLSRFEFNKQPNPCYRPGPFTLELQGGIRAYREPRPQVVLVSSAAVERNAVVGDDAVKRKLEVPIVQLNPGGVLNHKYAAEMAVRGSGLPYTVIRPTGMSDIPDKDKVPCLLEASQGDRITGVLLREDVAGAVVQALQRPEAAFKTFELRRSEAADAKNLAMREQDWLRLYLGLVLDRNRWHAGLQPFPKLVPPPPPPTEEQTQAILNDPRVQEVVARNKAKKEAEEKAKEAAAVPAS